MDTFTAAAVQVAPVFLDREASVEKAIGLIDDAATRGARLVVFPETWLPGYPVWIFGAAGWDDPDAKQVYAQLQRNAVQIPGPETATLCRAAKRAGVYVVMGVNERDAEFSTGTLYNTLLFIAPNGTILGIHRKLVPTHAERIVWGQGDGSTLAVFDTDLGRLGGLICWEHWMPLARFAMHAKGEQVHVAAWPEVTEAHILASRHYAFEGRCFVVCAGSYLTVDDLPAGFPLREAVGANGDFGQAPGIILPGGSGIIGPDGAWISGPVAGEETIVYGAIDLSRIAEEQQALDTAGHYNRPDVFQLTVDEAPRRQVRWLRPATQG